MSPPPPLRSAGEPANGVLPRWLRFATSGWTVLAILIAFWLLLVASVSRKSMTADEIVHAAGGYTYWRFNDYRINPENGNLPQRVGGLALALSDVTFPSRASGAWRESNEWRIGYDWFFRSGNDADRMLQCGRATCAVLAVAFGALVWWAARRLFGPVGGLVSLLLVALSPTVLANGALITSDTACTLLFLAATLAWWTVLHRVSPRNVLVSGLALGALFIAKMSALLILPIAAILAIARLCRDEPLLVELGGRWPIVRRARQAAIFVALGLAHAAAAIVVIWAAYGFRYSAFAPGSPDPRFPYTWEYLTYKPGPNQLLQELQLTREQNAAIARVLSGHHVFANQWTYDALDATREARDHVLTPDQRVTYDRFMAAPPPDLAARVLLQIRQRQWLPEAYLYGFAHAWSFSRVRGAFMNGQYSLSGWPTFFPYTFLVKTPLAVFALLALALVALVARASRMPAYALSVAGRARSVAYETIPLWTLFLVYWAALIPSHLNIGHRHMMVTYGPLFVLCGAVALWLPSTMVAATNSGWARFARFAVPALVAWLAVEIGYRFPNYLAYFNPIAGGPAHGYLHLVDSSLDWGQDLRAAKTRLAAGDFQPPVYLSYFGNGSPKYYGLTARLWHGHPGWDELEEPAFKKIDAPAAEAASALQRELAKYPAYDPDLIGRVVDGDTIHAVLVKKAAAFRLTGGTYLISATLLQNVLSSTDDCFGPWSQRYEETYQELARAVRPLLDDSMAVRRRALGAHDPDGWQALWRRYDEFRFARLTAFLRHREPTDTINGSILVYRLSDADIATALGGPPPELGPDVTKEAERRPAK